MMGESILQRCLIGTRGSVVKITMPGSQVKLQLCQVEIYGYPVNVMNLAFGKRAVESSTVVPASLATDGSTDLKQGSCARTKYEKNPWLQVDLAADYEILQVVITTSRSG
ncbi:hypothetical protein LSAT2_000117 [Lamellibrachia satsuma]|nr:hypothetical protein LSAT2_000117 [Lamellibrachia satsuma]